jgi:hypothetical protein
MKVNMYTVQDLMHLDDIDYVNSPGVYVWGFVYSKKAKPIDFSGQKKKTIDSKKHQFVPYYVGETKDIKTRLKEHSLVRSGDAAKYPRFSEEFMKVFFKWIPYQYKGMSPKVKSEHFKKILKLDNSYIQYYADQIILNLIFNNNNNAKKKIDRSFKRGQAGITELDNIIGGDHLWNLINTMDNFWFLHVKCDDFKESLDSAKDSDQKKDIKREQGILLRSIEKKVCLSLRGGTISHYALSADTSGIQIVDNSSTGVFKLDKTNKFLEEMTDEEMKVDFNAKSPRKGYF